MATAENSVKIGLNPSQEALTWVAQQFHCNDEFDFDIALETYARMQANACQRPAILAAFAQLDVASLPARLLQFLAPDAPSTAAAARYFLGRGNCASYHDAISRRAQLLGALLEKAVALPMTINHIDLQLPGVYSPQHNTPAKVSWSHTLLGPAGLSLPALFGSCAAPVALLAGDDVLKLAIKQRNLQPGLARYQSALAAQGYASAAALEEGLPAAICAAAINAVLCCVDNYADSNKSRERVKRNLRVRLSDLLDLCDLLALADRDSVLFCAQDYYNNDRRWRAERLLRGYLMHNESDAEIHGRFAWLLHKRGKTSAAINAYQQALALDVAKPSLHQQLGDVQLHELQFDKAHLSYGEALQHGGSREVLEKRIKWLNTLRHCEQQAQVDAVVPTLTLTERELGSKQWHEEHLALAVKLFHQHGVLLIHQAFSESLLETCYSEFIQRYAEYFTDKTHPHALRIGDKRYQISVALEGAFNSPSVYANPFILAIMGRLLGDEFLLGCSVCATALPAAKGQHLHKDHRALFADSADETPLKLPPFAITTMLPLVTLDEKIGTTRVKKGSHFLSQPDSLELPGQLPMVPLGSCFLMDLRLTHGGMANQTDRVRPIMNMVYQRYWFADSRNFAKHPPLRMSEDEYRRIPQQYRFLFDWGKQPGPQLGG